MNAEAKARIERAIERVDTFAETQDQDDDQTVLVDMLTDLKHWARGRLADFDRALWMADQHFLAEQRGEDT